MLDTNIVSHAIGHPYGHVAERIFGGEDDDLAISVIVAAELRFGAERKQSAKLTRRVAEWLSIIPVLAIDVDVAASYGVARATLERGGRPISANDMLIAAHALTLGATLVTDNVREFERVENLVVENWLRR